jgi:hypothetical protein
MFCPDCGKEESQPVPFCRACGTDLRRVRVAVETPEIIMASATSARDEIGRAVAAKIRETEDTYELKKVAEDVLPQIEKFLESPEERRLRRMRVGMLLSSIGVGVAVGLAVVAYITRQEEFLFLAGLGFVTIAVGLGFLLNGVFLTVPKDRALKSAVDAQNADQLGPADDISLPAASTQFASVTEHTTKHLEKR